MTDFSRQSMRLSGFDYRAEGYYFVTFCVKGHACLLGQISHGVWTPSDTGRTVEALLRTSGRVGTFRVEAYVVMPNHVHLLLSKDGPAVPP